MKKLYGILVLLIFLISALPLTIAEDNAVVVNAANTGTVDSATQIVSASAQAEDTDTGEGEDTNTEEEDTVEVELVTEDVSTVAARARTAVAQRIIIRAKNVNECVEVLKDRYPRVSEARIRSACNNAFKLRVVAATQTRLVKALPKIKRLNISKPETVSAFVENLPENQAELLQKLDRARLQQCVNNTEECKEKLGNWIIKKVKVKNLIRKRVIAKDKILQANNAFLRAKNIYLQAKNVQLRARNEFLNLKAQLAECEAGGEDCSDLEEQILDKAKENLIGIADRLIQHLEKVKSRVESAENMGEEEAEEAIANINDLIAELEDAKEDTEAATNQEELQEAAEKIRAIWKKIEYRAFRYAERVIWGEVKGIFVRSELLEKKLEEVLERLEEKGVNTGELEDLLNQFSEYIDEARENLRKADELFEEAKDLRSQGDVEGAKEKLEEAKKLTREAHQALKNAHRVLMELVKGINQSGESFDPDEINEEEEVEVVEEAGGEGE